MAMTRVLDAEALFYTVVNSFNFRPDSNACPGCPAPEEGPQTAIKPGTVTVI